MSEWIDLRKLLLGRQEQLATDLAVGRELVGHPTAKGDVAEFDWNGAIDGFLPGRYAVSNAFVIDADGQISEQIDIVVHDRHFCPLFFEHGGARFIPAESVFAVFEVKQELNKEHVEYAGEKAESVRELRRTDAPIVQRGEVKDPRGPFDIIAGILTLSSSWNPPFGEPFETALGSLDGDQRLDLGCAISDGAFEVNPESGEVEIGDAEGSLMFFLLRLFNRLQVIGSPMAIDLREYSRELDDEDTGQS
jgi:hypothetical protein